MDSAVTVVDIPVYRSPVAQVAPAADVNIAGGVGAWGLSAAWVEIVPAAAIADEFDIHWIYASNASAADTYELVLASGGAGSEVEIGRVRFTVPLGAISQASLPIITPINVAGARISAKLASSTGGDDIDMSLGYHTY